MHFEKLVDLDNLEIKYKTLNEKQMKSDVQRRLEQMDETVETLQNKLNHKLEDKSDCNTSKYI